MGMILLAWLPFQILNQPVCPPKGLAGSTKKTIFAKLSYNEKYSFFSSDFSLSGWVARSQINQFPLGNPKKSFTDFLIMVFYVTLELGRELRGEEEENAFVANF